MCAGNHAKYRTGSCQMRNVIAVVLGGGQGTRLFPLTKFRSKPAVPIGGKYRLIDIPLSNCIHSGIHRAYVLTQFLSVSLHRHIRQTYRFDHFSGGYIEIMAAQQTMDGGTDWYQGTADAVRKNIRYLQQSDVDYVLILSGDQLYRMDFRNMVRNHQETQADVSIAAKPVDRSEASSLGIMRIDDSGRVKGFLEKPQTDDEIDMVRMSPEWIAQQGYEPRGRECIANMGIYLFNRDVLVDVLTKTDYRDFGKEVFPATVRSKNVQVHMFDGYWEDIGTVRSFYAANLQLAQQSPPFNLYEPGCPIYTRPRYLPPTLISGATVSSSLIADGCQIGAGSVIENSVIGLRTIIGKNVVIRDSVIMGADVYDDDADSNHSGSPATPLGIGNGSTIVGAIIDKNCRIGANCRVVNEDEPNTAFSPDQCVLVDGIPVVVKEAILPDHTGS